MQDIDKYILIRDVGLAASGKLDKITINLTVNLKIPHHQGAGGEDDFVGKEAFQKQFKRKRKEKHKKNMKEAMRQKNNACQETTHVIGGRMSQHLHLTK